MSGPRGSFSNPGREAAMTATQRSRLTPAAAPLAAWPGPGLAFVAGPDASPRSAALQAARLLALLAILLATRAILAAQRGFGGGGFRGGDAPKLYLEVNVPYDGSFEFSRIRYNAVGNGFRRDPMWSHQYARAEANFTRSSRN